MQLALEVSTFLTPLAIGALKWL